MISHDIKYLESIFWGELGTKKDYEQESGDTPITRLIRQNLGLDKQAVKEAC